MNIVTQFILGFIVLVFLCFAAGAVETWWEDRKRDKEQKKRG